MNIDRYMAEALKEAERGCVSPWSMGAVIVRGNRALGRGHNRMSSSVKHILRKYGVDAWSLHAELDSLLNCTDDVRGAAIFISGIKKSGRRFNCKPCADCRKILRHCGVIEAYYQTVEGVEVLRLMR